MDLFTYLMAKNGNNTSVHGDLFSYLLGKGQSQTYTVSGTTIYIPNAKKLVSFMMTKESTQETTQGTNLIDFNNFSATRVNYTFDNDILSVETTTNDGGYVSLNITSLLNNNVGKVLRFDYDSLDLSNFTSSNSTLVQLVKTINGNTEYIRLLNSSETIDTYTIQENITSGILRIFASNSTVQTQSKVIYNKPILHFGNTKIPYEEYTGGIPSPNPDYPQEVKTVKGYRNLFDKDNVIGGWISASNDKYWSQGSETFSCTDYIEVKSNTTYIIDFHNALSLSSAGINEYNSSKTWLNIGLKETQQVMTFTTSQNTKYIRFTVRNDSFNYVQLIEGNQLKPYVPYGNNYVNVAVNDGTNTNNYPIPLNNNELVGIGNYKDELIVDKSGHVFINKKTKKIVLNGSENYNVYNASGNQLRRIAITYNIDKPAIFKYVGSNPFGTGLSNYFLIDDSKKNLNMFLQLTTSSTWYLGITDSDSKWATANDLKTWLSTHNTDVYYPLATPELIDLQTTVDLKLFKGVNNISNSEDGYMTIEYR